MSKLKLVDAEVPFYINVDHIVMISPFVGNADTPDEDDEEGIIVTFDCPIGGNREWLEDHELFIEGWTLNGFIKELKRKKG